MADGFDLSAIASAGTAMADDLGVAGKAQGVKIVVGADGVNGGYVDSSNPLPVLLTAGGASIGSATLTAVVPGTSATQLGKAVDSPAGGTDTGVALLGVRTTTPATITPANGDYAPLRLDDQGNLRVNITSGGSQASIDDSAFTPGSTEVVPIACMADETSTDSVDEGDMGIPRMTLDRKQITAQYAHTAGGWTTYSYISDGTDAAVVKASAGQLGWLVVTNINASPMYLKFYNSASAPTLGAGTPVLRFMVPGNSNGFTINLGAGAEFTTGIAFGIVTGLIDSSSTSAAANEVLVNLGYK